MYFDDIDYKISVSWKQKNAFIIKLHAEMQTRMQSHL